MDTEGKSLLSADAESTAIRMSTVGGSDQVRRNIGKDTKIVVKGHIMLDRSHLVIPADMAKDDRYLEDGENEHILKEGENEIIEEEASMTETYDTAHMERVEGQIMKPIMLKNIHSKDARNKRKREKKAKVREARNAVRLARTLFIIFIAFFICWTPYTLLCLTDRYDKMHKTWYSLAILMAHASSTLNSLLYAVTNRNFRNAYIIFMKKVCRMK